MTVDRSEGKKITQRVHRDYLLREAGHFHDHKKGLPEWLKNADDSMIRHEEFYNREFSNLPIILNLSTNEVICLDFGGATGEDMEKHVPYYGSPEAATQGKNMEKKVSGGHGNGGKYYGLSQFEECKVISYYRGKYSQITLKEDGDFLDWKDHEMDPEEALKKAGLRNWEYFSSADGKGIYEKLKQGGLNFFCWKGIKPKDKKTLNSKRKVSNLVNSITKHLQARRVLKNRTVHVLRKGKIFWRDLKPEEVDVDKSFQVQEFPLPDVIGGYNFNTTKQSILKVKLSEEPLTGEKSSLNILEIDANGAPVAYYPITSLMLDKGLAKSLAAHIDCPELKEYKCVSNDRVRLKDNNLTEEFIGWCRENIQKVLEEISEKEKKREQVKNLEDLSRFIQDVANEVSDLLEEDVMKPSFDTAGEEKKKVEVPDPEVEGYGMDGTTKKKGGGKRMGGPKEKKDNSTPKKSKSTIRIRVSNHDPDPLDPENTYDMIEREPVLWQRPQDVDYGIWWINSQKKYIRGLDIKNPGAKHFSLFLVKEIVYSQKSRQYYKLGERFDPDGLEELNFRLVDQIFNRAVEKLDIDLEEDVNMAQKFRETIRNRKEFTVPELAHELGITQIRVHSYLNNIEDEINKNFDIEERSTKDNGEGRKVKVFVNKFK